MLTSSSGVDTAGKSATPSIPTGPLTQAAIEYRVKPVGDCLLSVLGLWAGFAVPSDDAPRSKSTAKFGVALYSNLPVELPLTHVEVSPFSPKLYIHIYKSKIL